MKRLFKTLRKPLSLLESKVLLAALKLQVRNPRADEPTCVVADAVMQWPKSLHRQLYYWRFSRLPRTGRGNNAGLRSVFSDKVLRTARRYGTTPSQDLLRIISRTLTLCEKMAACFQKSEERDWPDLPAPIFRIESSDKLLASYRGDSQDAVGRWIHDCKKVFNSKEFVGFLVDFDAKNGFVPLTDEQVEEVEEWEGSEQRYYHYAYAKPLSFVTTPPIRDKGLSAMSVAMIAGSANPCAGIQDADSLAVATIAALRDRGYVLVCGEDRSSRTGRPLPSDIFLTCEGFSAAGKVYHSRPDLRDHQPFQR